MLVLLSGVSGAGKDTIKKELIKRNQNITSLPSYTDREPREGEVNGEIYNFITTEEFEELIKKGDLYEYRPERIKEYAERFGHCECLFLGEDNMTAKKLIKLNRKFFEEHSENKE